VRTAQAAIERPRAQRAAADADDANRVIGPGDRFGVGLDLADQRRLEGQVRESVLARIGALMETGQRGQPRGLGRGRLFGRQPVLRADHRGGEIGGIEMNGHDVV
jgi:hypothetical protein